MADGIGDPPRTLRIENAKEFENMEEAFKALTEARKFRPFNEAEIIDSFV